jgi:hypothetical protein
MVRPDATCKSPRCRQLPRYPDACILCLGFGPTLTMSLESVPSQPEADRPTVVQFVNQSIRDEHSKSMPSREERKENLNNMSAQCSYGPCGHILPRLEAKMCSRCKQVRLSKSSRRSLTDRLTPYKARYCGVTCQKAHWWVLCIDHMN